MEAGFFEPVQRGPGAHLGSYIGVPGIFPGSKAEGSGVNHPPLSSAEVKEIVELRFYSLSESSRPVTGLTFY